MQHPDSWLKNSAFSTTPSKQTYLHTRTREMATNDPRVPPEVQEKIRELEQELNEGKCCAFSAE